MRRPNTLTAPGLVSAKQVTPSDQYAEPFLTQEHVSGNSVWRTPVTHHGYCGGSTSFECLVGTPAHDIESRWIGHLDQLERVVDAQWRTASMLLATCMRRDLGETVTCAQTESADCEQCWQSPSKNVYHARLNVATLFSTLDGPKLVGSTVPETCQFKLGPSAG